MSFEVQVTPQAESDLRSIFEYIIFELKSPMNANGQLDRLEDAILKLDTLPLGYPLSQKEPWKNRGLRFVPIDNYIAYFIPNEETKIVTVLRVMYGGRNTDEQLNNHTTY